MAKVKKTEYEGAVPKIRPLRGFIHVEDVPIPIINVDRETGIIFQMAATGEPRVRFGIVRGVGQPVNRLGVKLAIEPSVKVGEVVIFDKYMGTQFDDNSYTRSKAWRIVDPSQLMGVVEGYDPMKDPYPKVEFMAQIRRARPGASSLAPGEE